MLATGKRAWFVLMNPKTRTAAFRSRGQTRPRLLRGCRAPAEVACSLGAAAPTRRVQAHRGPQAPPPAGPLSGGPWQPSHGSTDQSVQTPAQARRDRARHAPDRPSGDGTQANTVVWISASVAPLVKVSGCPPNRVNPSRRLQERRTRSDPQARRRRASGVGVGRQKTRYRRPR